MKTNPDSISRRNRIRKLLLDTTLSMRKIAKFVGVSHQRVSQIYKEELKKRAFLHRNRKDRVNWPENLIDQLKEAGTITRLSKNLGVSQTGLKKKLIKDYGFTKEIFNFYSKRRRVDYNKVIELLYNPSLTVREIAATVGTHHATVSKIYINAIKKGVPLSIRKRGHRKGRPINWPNDLVNQLKETGSITTLSKNLGVSRSGLKRKLIRDYGFTKETFNLYCKR